MPESRHLQLVDDCTPDDVDALLDHHRLMERAAVVLGRRGARLEMTVTDEDGNELTLEPAATAARAFMVRATAVPDRTTVPRTYGRSSAHIERRQNFGGRGSGVSSHGMSILVDAEHYLDFGMSQPIPRSAFLTEPAARRRGESEAVADLIRRVFPHPSRLP